MNCDYTESYQQIEKNKNDSMLSPKVNYAVVPTSSK